MKIPVHVWKSLFIAFLIQLCAVHSASAQYNIRIESKLWKDSTVILGSYLGENMLVTDSAKFNQSGVVTFKADTLLPQGMYTIYFPDKTYFDLLIGKDQSMKIEVRSRDLTKDVEISGSEESEAFSNYQKFMVDMQTNRKAIIDHYQPYIKNPDSLALARQKMTRMNEEVEHHWQKELEAHPQTFYAVVIKTLIPVKTPPANLPPSPKKDSLLRAYNYNYITRHYFDNTPLNDFRLWRTPFHQKKITGYLSNNLIPVPDSIIPHALRLVEMSKSDPQSFRHTASTVLNFAVKSDIMGMESLSVAVAKKFYLSGDAFWADSTLLAKLADLVVREEPSLLGKKAHDLVLEDWEAGYKSLYQEKAPYTILVFWEPGCSHCKETIPKLYTEVWNKYKSKGLAVFAVYTQLDKEDWKSFILDHELFEWTHVYDQHNRSNFRYYYNITVTPKIYLLDADKKIIGKNIGVENLDKMLDRLYLYGKLY